MGGMYWGVRSEERILTHDTTAPILNVMLRFSRTIPNMCGFREDVLCDEKIMRVVCMDGSTGIVWWCGGVCYV